MDNLIPTQFSRRRVLQLSLAGAAAVFTAPFWRPTQAMGAANAGPKDMIAFEKATYPFELPELPYAYDALEPQIDAKTMEIHHDKHHAAYVKNLNAALEKNPDQQKKTLLELISEPDSVPEDIRTAVRNNGGGHANHALFWLTLSNPGTKPSAALSEAIDKDFGTMENLAELLKKAGASQFGSGWSWLCLTPEKKLTVIGMPNQDSPWRDGNIPLFGIDVWEHAYYLKYQNLRGEYLNQILNVVDWANVSKRYEHFVAE